MIEYNKNEDIFIIDCWTDTQVKEDALISLIKMLKQFDIPILVTGHYPLKLEIQNMVDYFLFDKENPLLLRSEFESHDVTSGRWSKINDCLIENKLDFHHDYAIWTAMKNAFKFANDLGKKYIHFLEYDNLPNPEQYRQAFLEYSRKHDAILYEYVKDSVHNQHLSEFSATFIFSIKTSIAVELISRINSKKEYFYNRPGGWQLERIFLQNLKDITKDIYVSKYIANNNELNTLAVWDRDGLLRNGEKFQIYLATDKSHKLFIHFISGFTGVPARVDCLVEIVYGDFKKFHIIKKDQMSIMEIGKYRRGDRVKVYYLGVEAYNEFLNLKYDDFFDKNKLTHQTDAKRTINMNFIDGPFVEILENETKQYDINFIDNTTGINEYQHKMESNHWAKGTKKYFVDWKIKIDGEGINSEHLYDCTNQRVLIGFESNTLGDTLAWIPYVEEFRKKHNCTVICSTFHNKMFKYQYPEIKFVEPGTTVHNLYSLYHIGLFKTDKGEFDNTRNPTDPKVLPLQKIASDILGLEFEEIKPKIKKFGLPKKKKVCIALHSTAQAKYWNYPNGWQEITDYLFNLGYEVMIVSREENGFMGNFHPKGVQQLPSSSIDVVMQHLQESELFIGTSSGLSWLSWACDTPTILISGFTDETLEPQSVHRVINKSVCHGCWSRHEFDPGDWNWCPEHKGTDRAFECSKKITPEDVIEKINIALGL